MFTLDYGWLCLLTLLVPGGIVLQYWILRWAVRHGMEDVARRQRLHHITHQATTDEGTTQR